MFFRRNQVMRPAWGGSGGQALDIGNHYAVTRYISVVRLTAIDDLGRVMAQAA